MADPNPYQRSRAAGTITIIMCAVFGLPGSIIIARAAWELLVALWRFALTPGPLV